MDLKSNLNLKKNIIWNSFGSIFLLVSQWLITVLVVRFSSDYTNAGILSLAMSITNIFAIIALFNVRNYQVSDEGNFSSGEYIIHRAVTSSIAFILCFLTALIGGYERFVIICILGFMLLKLSENFADVFHGIVQKRWRLDIAGKSFVLRGALTVISFIVGFLFTKNLAVAIFLMAISNILSLLIYDYCAARRVEKIEFKTSPKKILNLSLICLPMVGYGLCIHSITPIAKCLLDAFHGTENLGYYSSITTVSSLIQSFSIIIFTPLVGLFADYYLKNNRRGLAKLTVKLLLMISGAAILALILVYLIGDFVMAFVFGEGILEYVYLLYPTIIASALTAFVWLLGMILVVMRSIKTLLSGAVIGFVTSLFLSLALIPKFDFKGTNIAIILGFAVIAVIYISKVTYYLTHANSKKIQHSEIENGTENP